MKKMNKILSLLVILPLFSIAAEQTQSKPSSEFNKAEFDKKIYDIINRPSTVIINDEQEYIYNLKTTKFIQGLFVQSSYLNKYIANNSKDHEKLSIAIEDLAFNTMCLQASIGKEALPHLNTINILSLPTDQLKSQYKEGMTWITTKNEIPKINPEMLKMCKDEGIKAAQYQKENKKAN